MLTNTSYNQLFAFHPCHNSLQRKLPGTHLISTRNFQLKSLSEVLTVWLISSAAPFCIVYYPPPFLFEKCLFFCNPHILGLGVCIFFKPSAIIRVIKCLAGKGGDLYLKEDIGKMIHAWKWSCILFFFYIYQFKV